jgi:hypothetical protein
MLTSGNIQLPIDYVVYWPASDVGPAEQQPECTGFEEDQTPDGDQDPRKQRASPALDSPAERPVTSEK